MDSFGQIYHRILQKLSDFSIELYRLLFLRCLHVWILKCEMLCCDNLIFKTSVFICIVFDNSEPFITTCTSSS